MRRPFITVLALICVAHCLPPAAAKLNAGNGQTAGDAISVITLTKADGWPPCAVDVTVFTSDTLVANRTFGITGASVGPLATGLLLGNSLSGFVKLPCGELWPAELNLRDKTLKLDESGGVSPTAATECPRDLQGVENMIGSLRRADLILEAQGVVAYSAVVGRGDNARISGQRLSAGYQRRRWIPEGVPLRKQSRTPFQIDFNTMDVRSTEDRSHMTGVGYAASVELRNWDPKPKDVSERLSFVPNRSVSATASWQHAGPIRGFQAGVSSHFDCNRRIGFDGSLKWASSDVDTEGRKEGLVGVIGADVSPFPNLTLSVQETLGDKLTNDAIFGAGIAWYPSRTGPASIHIGWTQPGISLLTIRLGSEK